MSLTDFQTPPLNSPDSDVLEYLVGLLQVSIGSDFSRRVLGRTSPGMLTDNFLGITLAAALSKLWIFVALALSLSAAAGIVTITS